MPQGLVDLGGGVQMLNPTDLTSQIADNKDVASALSLVNLKNQIENAPLEKAKLEAEKTLKENEVTQINVSNELQKQQLLNMIGNERRDQAKFTLDAYKQLPLLFQVGFSYGQGALRTLNPNAQASENPDRTVTVEFPSQKIETDADGKQTVVPTKESIRFSPFPSQLTTEQKLSLENQSAGRFMQDTSVKDFAEISQSYQNFKDSSTLATGQGDQNMMYAYIKMNNPGASIRPGQQATIENMGSLFNTLGNLWNKAFTESAPVFGKANSKERTNFINAANILYKNSRQGVLAIGQHAADFANSQGLNADAILAPVGDISVREFKETPQVLLDRLNKKYGSKSGTP